MREHKDNFPHKGFDPKIISLDIETYGAARHTNEWKTLPTQRFFHPRKSEYWQTIPRNQMVLTCAITIAKKDTRTDGRWDKNAIAKLVPGETFVLDLSKEMHRQILSTWWNYADTIIGSNLQFDLLYLRHCWPGHYRYRNNDKTLIDTTIAAYLWNELSSSRSLKKLGPLLGQFTYDSSLKDGARFNHPSDKKLHQYNAEDTHNTILVLSELAKRMPEKSDKLSEFCVKHYSDAIYSVVEMSEAGIPFSSLALEDLHSELQTKLENAKQKSEESGLVLSGTGSAQSKDEFFNRCISMIQGVGNENILDDLEVTPKAKKVSHSRKNRITLEENLSRITEDQIDDEQSSELEKLFDTLVHFGDFQDAQKLLSTYVVPLLYHKRNDVTNVRSSLIPFFTHEYRQFFPHKKAAKESLFDGDTVETCLKNNSDPTPKSLKTRFNIKTTRWEHLADCAAYPSWFITPSRVKNDEGSSGGTIQGRITCKDPSAQTFPPQIKKCIRTRFPGLGSSIIGIDLSQIELRVAALLSGERSMMDSYINKKDLHADRARSLWPEYDNTDDKERKSLRQVGKMMNFADLFLSSANTMKQQVYALSGGTIDLPLDIFRKVVDTREEVRPQLTSWQKNLIRTAKNHGKIELPFLGQSRYFSDISAERSEIVNFPVQTTASNIMMQIQSLLTTQLKKHGRGDPKIFLQIFDAVYIDCPQGSQDFVVESFDYVMKHLVSEEGYWGMLCSHLERDMVPLEYDVETLDKE
jgi:DNA polymerase I-like protein with 3'-5' exonuclease and polymerase domains